MGLLVEGTWQDRWYDTKDNGGKFVRGAIAMARLGHARRRAGRRPGARLQGRTRPLPSLCLARLSRGRTAR